MRLDQTIHGLKLMTREAVDSHYPPPLNLSAVQSRTRVLGPGVRMGVWVQGCPFQCAGCIAPEWMPQRVNHLVTPEQLAMRLLADPDIHGITLSGGEPMLQAGGLAAFVRSVRQQREVDVICFTGYRYARLQSSPPNPGVAGLLAEVDLLIDGPYVQSLNDGRGLRGSSNQVFHHLTERLRDFDPAQQPRQVEIYLQEGQAFLVGIPPLGLSQAWEGIEWRQA